MSNNDDVSIIYLNEDIPEIEYFELVSIDEILKTNPNFIAFSREEIYNELFNFVKTKPKTECFLKLFYEIVKKNINVNNFVIIADANRGEFETEIIEEFINDLKKYDKINDANLAFTSKNKLWFPLKYDANNDKIRFKASQKTVIELSENNNFIVFKDDETNIPVMAVYFYSPVTILNDYLNDKIMDHLHKPEKLEILDVNDDITTFEDLITKYKIPIPIHKIDEDNYNYVSINNLLLKYNYSLDNISQNDFTIIKTHLDKLNSNQIIEKPIYNSIQIKPIQIHNPRFTFFNILKEIKVLIDLTLKSTDIIAKQLQSLQSLPKKDIKSLDITRDLYAIITNLTDKNYDAVIKNIKELRQNLSTDTAIIVLEKFKSIDKKLIIEQLDDLEIRFELLKYVFADIYKLNFSCTDDEHEIYIGTDETNYEGIPSKIGRSNEPEENFEYDDGIDDKETDETQFEKYYTNSRYSIEPGFIELLKLVLPYLFAMQEESPLPLNYDNVVLYLFNKYRTFDPKIIILRKYLPDIDEDIIIDYCKKSIKYLLLNHTDDKKIINAINEYFNNFKDIMYDIIAYWSINIQKDIVHNTLFFNQEKIPNYCDDTWDEMGAPYNMDSKKGIVYFLASIFKEVYIKIYNDNYANLLSFNNDYIKIILTNIKTNFTMDLDLITQIKMKQTKVNKGRQYYDTLFDILKNRDYKSDKFIKAYIDALIYMPSLKFIKIHKYLQGCCLERIDQNFTADLYLKTDRQDLKKAKEKLTGKRVFNMPRSKRFFIKKTFKKPISEQFIKIQNPITYDIISIDIHDWISQLLENNNYLSTVFTKDVLLNLQKSIVKTTDNYKDLFITYFNNKELKLLLHKYTFDNYTQIASIVSKTLFKFLKQNAFQFLTIISKTLEELHKLNSIITDDNIMDIINIRRIAIIRIMSLPSSPESVVNKKFIPSIDIHNDIYQELFAEINQNIINNLKMSHMLDVTEQVDFINQIREKNKFDILARMNKKSREDKDIEKELKKYGLQFTEELLDNEIAPTINKIKSDDFEENEGEAEYELEVEDDEGDDEFGLSQNYGFIYAQ
jgi:hypothetical protein